MITATDERGWNAKVEAFLAPAYPLLFFLVEFIYLAVLLWLFWRYNTDHSFRRSVHDPLGLLPLVVPWAGATGAVTAGMFGIYFHNQSWDKRYNYWYFARPVTGAVLGGFAYVFFVALIDATGSHPKTSSNFIYAAIAFIVGFREKTFFNLLTHAADVILGPSNSKENKGDGRDSKDVGTGKTPGADGQPAGGASV
jgi:hypothetical protein